MAMVIPEKYRSCPDCSKELRQYKDGDCILVCENEHYWIPPMFAWGSRQLRRATFDNDPLRGIRFGERKEGAS